MLRLPIFLSLFLVCLSLDLNGGLTKKYAFMKIMSGCLGEDFVMMVKEQMMKACTECYGRDMNDTQQHNLDYLMNSFRISQQSIPITPQTKNNPMYVYYPVAYPISMQSPNPASPSPQFLAQYLQGQHASAFPQFPVQHQQQHNALSQHHTSLKIGQHSFNFPNNPNIPHEHHTPTAPQYDLTNLDNLKGFIDDRSQYDLETFDGHEPNNIGQIPIQNHHSTNKDAQDPVLQNVQLRSPIPNNQLGYPDSVHHERQFYELNPQPVVVEAQKRKKRSLPLSPENLETLKKNLSIKMGNMTCVFREMGWLTEENDVNFTFIEQQINTLNLNVRLQEDLFYIHNTCKDFSMCMPTEKSKHPLMRELGGVLSYMKCMNTKAVTACMKNDFRIYQAKMGYGSLDTGFTIEMDHILGNENTDPSQLADDIGALVFADAAEFPL